MSYQLHLGDAFEMLPLMADASVDHVITDPPYGEKTHNGARTGTGDDILINFAHISREEFMTLCREAVRVAKRWVIMSCEWRYAALAEEAGLPVIRLGVWVKPNGAPQFTGDRPATGWEAILILHREGKKRWNGGGHTAIWQYPAVCNAREILQPTQKPVPLIKKWIAQFTDIGETILDPFAGSATTGVACLQTSRHFIGIEKDPARYAAGLKRLQDAAAQPLLLEVA